MEPRHPLDIIKEQLDEIKSNPSEDFTCRALEGNPYDWQFAIRGPNGTEFEGGIYHGQIQFPEGYPRKRPKFTLLTENGCFKIQTDIGFLLFCGETCTVRDALHKLIELLPTHPDGAFCSVVYDKEERRALAIKSHEAPPKYGTEQRQKLINEIHECMLRKAAPGYIWASFQKMFRGAWKNKQESTNAIQKELKEMQSNPSDDFKFIPLAGNPYDWQVAIRGPNGTDFEGGIYHARIEFPKEYPHMPPIYKLLTRNGRFNTKTQIGFPWHPMNVRYTLLGLIELLPTEPDGSLGSAVGYDKEKRHALAIKSREAPPRYGPAPRQKLINENHEYMDSKAPLPPLPSNGGGNSDESSQNDLGKRKRGSIMISGSIIISENTINANNSNQVGIFDFGNKRSKKGKQVGSSGETGSTSTEDNQE